MKNIVFTLSIFLSFSLLGQDTINNIKHNIKSIESSITDSVTFSIEELYGVVTDGGGSVKTYFPLSFSRRSAKTQKKQKG